MKKNLDKVSNPKPYRQLLPVIVFLGLNLIIYLYFITVNTKELNLYKPTASDYSALLIIGSYITTTIAMLLTLTSYFSLKAYMKRDGTETPPLKIADSKSPDKDKKAGKIDVTKKDSQQKDVSISKAAVEAVKTEPKSPEKHIDQAHEKDVPQVIKDKAPQEPFKINKIKDTWKKIEIKIEDGSKDNNATKTEEIEVEPIPATIDEQTAKISPEIKKDDEKVINPIINLIDSLPKPTSLITEPSISIQEPKTMAETTPKPSIEILTGISQLQSQPELEVENMFSKKRISTENLQSEDIVEEDYDSEVIRNLQELKQIVKDMKKTIKNKQAQTGSF